MAHEEMKRYALEHGVPIMSDDSLNFISSIIKETNSRSVLEIGTAIAFSGIYLASDNPNIKLTTLEKDEERFKVAQDNISKNGFEDQIKSVLQDGLKYRNRASYDVVIVDAAKAQNEPFFKLYFAFTNKVLIIDNIDFHGKTGHSDEIKHRSLRQMVKRIENLLTYINGRTDLESEKYDIGDGILVIKRKQI